MNNITNKNYLYFQIEDTVKAGDIAMKNILYSMLCVEGSYKSQEVWLSHCTRRFIIVFAYQA